MIFEKFKSVISNWSSRAAAPVENNSEKVTEKKEVSH